MAADKDTGAYYEYYLKEIQFRRKMPPFYFFFSKEGIVWVIAMIAVYHIFSFMFFMIILVVSYLYMLKNNFNYLFFEKEKLYVFSKLKKILGRGE